MGGTCVIIPASHPVDGRGCQAGDGSWQRLGLVHQLHGGVLGVVLYSKRPLVLPVYNETLPSITKPGGFSGRSEAGEDVYPCNVKFYWFVIDMWHTYLVVGSMPKLAVLREASCHDSGSGGFCEPDCEVRSTGDSCRFCDGDCGRVELHVCQQGSPPRFLISSEGMFL